MKENGEKIERSIKEKYRRGIGDEERKKGFLFFSSFFSLVGPKTEGQWEEDE